MSTLAKLVVEINGDASGLTRTFGTATTQTNALSARLRDASSRFVSTGRASDGLYASLNRTSGAVSGLTTAVAGFLTFQALRTGFRAVTEAADAQEAAVRRLTATSRLLHQDLGELGQQAQKTAADFHLSSRVALDFTGSMARLTSQAGQMNRLGQATNAWLELAAANGVSAEESMDALRLTILGQDEGLNKLGLANPSGLYKQWAEAAGVSAGKMNDMQKAQAILDAVIKAGESVRGSYSAWLESAAGQQALLRSRVEESNASIGRAFNGIRVAVLPVIASLVEKLAVFSGGIQILGADMVVGAAQVSVWAASVRVRVGTVMASFGQFFLTLSRMVDSLPAPLKRMLGFDPSRSQTAGISNWLENATTGSAASLSAAMGELGRARAARDEIVENILRDASGFGNLATAGTGGLDRIANAADNAAGKARELRDELDGVALKLRDLAKAQIASVDLLKRTGLPFMPNIPNPERIDPGPLPAADRVALGVAATAAELNKLRASAQEAAGALKDAAGTFRNALAEGVAQMASGSSEFIGNAMRMGQHLMSAGKGLAAAGPQAIAFAAAMEVASGFFAVIGPVVNALMIPLQIMGQVIGMLIVPVLKILWQPLKILGIVVSYIGEVIAKVAGAIAHAIGSLVRGIGRLVNKLPGSPGDPLVKAGQAMIDLGKEFKDAAKDMAAKRKELEGLSFDDAVDRATNGLDRLTESLTNVPPLFNLALRRLQASTGQAPTTPSGGVSPPPFNPPKNAPPPQPQAPVIIVLDADGNVKTPSSGLGGIIEMLARRLESASDAKAREMGLSLRMAGG